MAAKSKKVVVFDPVRVDSDEAGVDTIKQHIFELLEDLNIVEEPTTPLTRKLCFFQFGFNTSDWLDKSFATAISGEIDRVILFLLRLKPIYDVTIEDSRNERTFNFRIYFRSINHGK